MYEFLDHSSDLEVSVVAGGFQELLSDSVEAITSVVATRVREERKVEILLEGNPEEKLMHLLEEVIYLQGGEGFYVSKIELRGEKCVLLGGSAIVKDEIKAITWHEFWVKQDNGWQAHFICDL